MPEPATDEYVREASEDVGEVRQDAIVPEAPTDPTLLSSYVTHVTTSIWQYKVMFLRFKIFTY